MAMVTAAIANKGRMMRPYLVAAVAERNGHVVREIEPAVWRQPISDESAAIVRDLMVDTVVSGYANGASIGGLVVGGKSGTAETGDGEPHAWFIGFVGDPEPRYAVAVVLEHGGAGLAAPLDIAREMLAVAMRETSN
jgi:peptidoglycan glycosyltransferase